MTSFLCTGCEYQVCEGIEKALEKFKIKEKSKLQMKSSAAFGAAGKPEFNIPPNADVEYVVELNNFEKVSGILRYCYTFNGLSV